MSDGERLRFGLVGCGSISQVHRQAIAAIPEITLAAVADVNEDAARTAAQDSGCRYFTDYRDMIRDGGIDVVDICTPSGMRKDIAIFAAKYHKHIILEKPIEVTTERIDTILAAAAANQVTVHGIFGKRFFDLYRWLRDVVDSGRLGGLFWVDIAMKWYRPPSYYANSWRGTWALDGGGALMNQCIHYVDLLQWFMGMPARVFACTGNFLHTGIETEDTAAAILKFPSGAIGMIQASTAMIPGFSARFSLHGRDGGVLIEDDGLVDFRTANLIEADESARARFSARREKVENVATHIVSDFEPHRRQLTEIAQSIQKGVPSAIDGREARKAVAIINAIYRSAAAGQEILLET